MFCGAEIDWEATGAWAQFFAAIFAIIAAVIISRAELNAQRTVAAEDLLARRRAAWKTMRALVGVIGRKKLATAVEIRSVAAVLDKLDLPIFPEEAVFVLVGLQNRVAMAVASIEAVADNASERAAIDFNMEAELHNLSTIRTVMGMEEGHEGRRPRTLPFFTRRAGWRPAQSERGEDQ